MWEQSRGGSSPLIRTIPFRSLSDETAVPVFTNTFFERRVEQLFDLVTLVEKIFSAAGMEYRLVGGLAAYLYVEESQPDAGRLTRDVDIAIRRLDLEEVVEAAARFGLRYRHAAGVHMLLPNDAPSARRAIHLVFAGEKVRPDYSEPVPELGPCRAIRGIRVIRLPDLVRMKLTSFRAKDETHLKDMDEAGLITPVIEAGLPTLLRERLARMRDRD
jgi:hypothetical protein